MAVQDTAFSNVGLREETRHTVTNDCFHRSNPCFAMPRHGNKVTAITTGKDLFSQAATAIASAKKFIMLADWQMDYDVELTDRGSANYSGRLSELLAKKVAEGVEVKVLLYDSVEAALYTHENHVRQNLMLLNPTAKEFARGVGPKKNPAGNLPVEVALQKPMTGRAFENIAFAHHQKTILVDGKVAFVGGMDLCYGRWCDANFDVVIDPVRHRINDMYNPGLPGGRLLTADEVRLTQPWAGSVRPQNVSYGPDRPGFARPYYIIGILMQRAKELWEKGYSIEQIVVQLDAMALPEQIQDYFKKTYRRLRALTVAIDRVLSEYSSAKTDAYYDILQGNIRKGIVRSVNADLKLASIVAKQLNKAFDSALESALDWVGENAASFRNWFNDKMHDFSDDLGDLNRYIDNPTLLKQDAERLWQDIKDLPSQIFDDFALEEGCQPRMPWQDAHAMIEGPAVFDVYRNFVRRWNVAIEVDKENARFEIKPLTDKWLSRWGAQDQVFGDVTKPGSAGNVSIQIVRSMSAVLWGKERQFAGAHPMKDVAIDASEAEYANAGEGNMDGILESMIKSIRGAKSFIYIENQFFLSDCRKSRSYEDSPTKNIIVQELANRIGSAIMHDRVFHVYVVMPVHPEGNLNTGTVAKQQYWALQTIKHGRNSLIRRVCEFIARKKHKLSPGERPSGDQIEAEISGSSWSRYLTFLNLRGWGATAWFERDSKGVRNVSDKGLKGQFVITEQVYVHSKLMIVDDAIAIIGSANINDRSLQGNGDTEIAAVIVDNEVQQKDLGNGVLVPTRTFASDLRKALWRKHLGLEIDPGQYMRGDRSGSDNAIPPSLPNPLPYPPRRAAILPPGIDLDRPASMQTIQAIQALAARNAATFEAVFQHVPTNAMKRFSDTESGWPRRLSRAALSARVANKYASGGIKSAIEKFAPDDRVVTDFSTVPPKLQSAFMRKARADEPRPYKSDGDTVHDVSAAMQRLRDGIVGHWVAMPLDFGIDEHDVWLGGKTGAFMTAQRNPEKAPDGTRIARVDRDDESQKAGA